jgi:rhomboid protease GluP
LKAEYPKLDKRRMCPNCRAFITTDDKVCPYCEVQVGPKAIERRAPSDLAGGLIPHAHFTTIIILLLNTGLYIATLVRTASLTGNSIGTDPDGRVLLEFGAKFDFLIRQGEWWRLITAGFLHGNLMHILMNSWVLFDLGAQVEENYGTSRYLLFYILSTITGFLASFYWSTSLSIGASAGIFGLIGAMIALGVRDRSSYGTAVRGLYTRWAVYGLLMGLLPIFATDNAAHVGGLAGGFAIAFVAGTPSLRPERERVWQVLAGIALAVTAWSFAQMVMGLMSSRVF